MTIKRLLAVAALVLISGCLTLPVRAAEDAEAGSKVFKIQCSACHAAVAGR